MTTIPKLEAFDETIEDVSNYLLRLKHFMKINAIKEDDEKVSVLLTVLGPKIVKLLSDLLAPEEVDSKSYEFLVNTLTDHFKPKRLIIVERFKFNTRSQQSNETITDYTVQIKHLAATCQFGNFFKEALRDRLVSGLRDDCIRQKLLTDELDFEQSYQRARMLEEAKNNQNMFATNEAIDKVVLQP